MPVLKDHECHLPNPEEPPVNQFIDSGIFILARRKFRTWCMISRIHPKTSTYFKSHGACREEEIRHLFSNYYMIHPFSKMSLYWEFYMFLILTIHFVYIPVNASIHIMDRTTQMFLPSFILDFLYVIDVIVQFNTGYYDKQRSKVILQYWFVVKKRWLLWIIDIISSIHIYLFITEELAFFYFSTMIRFLMRVLSRLKIIRLGRWLGAIELFRKYLGLSSYLINGIKVISVFVLIIFWAFSIHFFIENFVEQFISGVTEKPNKSHGLFKFYYEATLLLLLVSFGKYIFTEIVEYMNITFFVCFGFALQLYLYAQILQVWNKYARRENKHLSLHKQFQEYMKYKELPLSLQQRIFSYFNFTFYTNFFRESEITGMASPLLKEEILLHAARNHVERVDLFKNIPDRILMKVVAHLKTQTYLPGDVIVSAGEVGSTMYFINQGTVAVYSASGNEICHLDDGDHFGEIALILSETRVASVVAVTASELFALKRSDFLIAIDPYPEFKEQLINRATERLQNSTSDPEVVVDENKN